jgi:hypothetical protein
VTLGDDEIEAWGIAQRRKAGIRILGVGLVLLVPALVWLVAYMSWDSNAPITRIKVVGGIAVAIGGLLALAGAVTIARAKHRPGDPPIPIATARERDR